MAARANRATPAASVHSGIYLVADYGFYGVALRPWLCRRQSNHHGLGKISWAPGSHCRPPKGARHEAAAGSEFRAAQTRRLPESITRDATRGKIWAADFYIY